MRARNSIIPKHEAARETRRFPGAAAESPTARGKVLSARGHFREVADGAREAGVYGEPPLSGCGLCDVGLRGGREFAPARPEQIPEREVMRALWHGASRASAARRVGRSPTKSGSLSKTRVVIYGSWRPPILISYIAMSRYAFKCIWFYFVQFAARRFRRASGASLKSRH